MLHRGKYCDGETRKPSVWTGKNLYGKLIGITDDYTRGDKIIAWLSFSYTIVFRFLLAFCGVIVWNLVSPWPAQWWSHYFLVISLMVPCVVAAVSTVWSMVDGVVDLCRLFRDLAVRRDKPLGDGRVEGHVSLADLEPAPKNEEKNDHDRSFYPKRK